MSIEKKSMVFQKKDTDFLSEDMTNIKELLSFNLGFKSEIKLVGSASIKSQINYQDYDYITYLKLNTNYKRFRINVLSNIETLINKYNSIITDIKFGINQLKYFENKKNYKGKQKVLNILNFISSNKYYTDDEKNELNKLYNKIDWNDILTIDDFLDEYRRCYTLRWSIEEIKQGYILLTSTIKKEFDECIMDPAIFKIDVLCNLRGGIEEVSNIIFFMKNNKILNKPLNYNLEIKELLKSDITYYWKSGSYFKALKRLFNITKDTGNINLGNELITLFNSSIGLMYKINSLLKNIKEFNKYINKKSLKYEIDIIKEKINNVWGIDDDFFNTITLKLEQLKNNPHDIDKMEDISEQMEEIYNNISFEYIKEIKQENYIKRLLSSSDEYINNFF
jgi:hypothetical protein